MWHQAEFRAITGPLRYPPAMIYFLQGKVGTPIKIGYTQTAATLASRVSSLQTGYPWRLRVLARCDGTKQDERRIHEVFAGYRLMGEWFDPAPRMGQFIAECVRAGVRRALAAHRAAIQADGSSQWDELFVGEARSSDLLCLRAGALRAARLENRAPPFRVIPAPTGCGVQRFYRVGDLRRWLAELGHPPRINPNCLDTCRTDPAVRRKREGSCWNISYEINTYGAMEPRP